MLCVLDPVWDGVGALAEMVSSMGLGGRRASQTGFQVAGQAALAESAPTYQVPYILLVSKGGEFEKNMSVLQNRCPELCGEMSVGLSRDRLVGRSGVKMDFGEVTPGKKLSQGRPNPSGLCDVMVPTRQTREVLTQPSLGAPFPRPDDLPGRPPEISSWAR